MREASVDFYTDTKFYSAAQGVFVAPFEAHLLFKERFLNAGIKMPCKCLLQNRGRCTNCKTKCFTLNFAVNKLKLMSEWVPENINLKPINEYLKKDVDSMIFWHYCQNCFKIVFSLDNFDEKDFLKSKKIFGS